MTVEQTTEEKKTPFIDLPSDEQNKIMTRLNTFYKLLDIQAKIEEAKSRHIKARFEQIVFGTKIAQFQNPSNESDSKGSQENSETEGPGADN